MTSVIRYVKNSLSDGPCVNSTGFDHQLAAIDVCAPAGLAAGAEVPVLTWTGAGKIRSIVSIFLRRTGSGNTAENTGEIIPLGAAAPNAHAAFKLDEGGKTITCSLPADAAPAPAFTTLSFLLIIGNYES